MVHHYHTSHLTGDPPEANEEQGQDPGRMVQTLCPWVVAVVVVDVKAVGVVVVMTVMAVMAVMMVVVVVVGVVMVVAVAVAVAAVEESVVMVVANLTHALEMKVSTVHLAH